jgi:hypothetical protein
VPTWRSAPAHRIGAVQSDLARSQGIFERGVKKLGETVLAEGFVNESVRSNAERVLPAEKAM